MSNLAHRLEFANLEAYGILRPGWRCVSCGFQWALGSSPRYWCTGTGI